MIVEGRTEVTKMLHAMRQLRGAYMENVRAGKCKLDEKVLAEFDAELEALNETVHRKPKRSQRPV